MPLFTIRAGDVAVEPGNVVFVRIVQGVKIVKVVKSVEAAEVSGWRSEIRSRKSEVSLQDKRHGHDFMPIFFKRVEGIEIVRLVKGKG